MNGKKRILITGFCQAQIGLGCFLMMLRFTLKLSHSCGGLWRFMKPSMERIIQVLNLFLTTWPLYLFIPIDHLKPNKFCEKRLKLVKPAMEEITRELL